MGNTPSIARKHTRTSQQKKQAELDEGIRLTYDGVAYQISVGDLTALDSLALRREVGLTFGMMRSLPEEEWDIDIIAAFIWLARRVNGEKTLRFVDVAKDITYDSVDELLDLEVAEDPEPPGESQPVGD